MGKSVSFIHAADLHLGAPFKGLRSLSPVWAAELTRAIPEAYKRLVDTAIRENVDFVVISGDIFDDSRPSYADFFTFINGLKKLDEEGIQVYFCTGNHDPLTTWNYDLSALPKNTHMFTAEDPSFEVFEKEGEPLVVLAGRGYYNQTWPKGVDISKNIWRDYMFEATGVQAPFTVAVVHTGLNIDPTRSPLNPKDLITRGVDYWACGHIHQYMVFPKKAPRIAFPGCPQGRDIKETGEHGVLKVTLEEGNTLPHIRFIPTASVVWENMEVDVSGCNTVADIHELITNKQFFLNSKTHCQKMICRVTLVGNTKLHEKLTNSVIEDLRLVINNSYPYFFIDAIQNHTRPEIDFNSLLEEGLFPSVYLKTVAQERLNSAEALADIEKEFYDRNLSFPQKLKKDFNELCDEAEILVLDLLSQGGAR